MYIFVPAAAAEHDSISKVWCYLLRGAVIKRAFTCSLATMMNGSSVAAAQRQM